MYGVFLLLLLLGAVWLLMINVVFVPIYFLDGLKLPFWGVMLLLFLGFSWFFGD